MKQSVVTSLVALAVSCSVRGSDPYFTIITNKMSGRCNQHSSGTGLVNLPIDGCIAALGKAKCDQASSASNDGGSLINVPINICLAVLGEAHCQQKSESTGGLINIPINLCLAVLGEADCQDASSSSASTTPTAVPNTISAEPSATGNENAPIAKETDTISSGHSTSAAASASPALISSSSVPSWIPSSSHSNAPSVSSSAIVSKHTVTSTISRTKYVCHATCGSAQSTSLRLIPTTTAVASASSSGSWSAPATTSPAAFNAAGRATLSGVAVVFGALCAAAMQI
ncbi:hypothetical protein N7495_007271 [Penicillium taxi]|uniref:uncharacterized protein n=1 Tax=Penicillium taxi TaxID=168475 RepID=UPI002544E59A|nr:uncharacterized protein N7495_007271 [Penicillium taxi]KAJ5895580.1 hypothetical protein N7495_007271 [Penicillium taxi]